MPTSVSNSRNSHSSARKVIGFDDYIDRQLAKVRTYVRLSDLAVAIVTSATLVGALLFLAVLFDHWIADLGRFGRFAVLVVSLCILGYALVTQIVPLLAKRINPAYVANMIERSEPSLKNSLLNFVFFRTHSVGLRKVVLEAVERQAAADLSRVDVDGTIDRTPLIRMGVALGVLMFAFVLYAFLSPKDPLASIARVILPFEERARPSRVEIRDVDPGTTSIYSGRNLDVSATIHRLGDDEQPYVSYSTVDGQISDAKLDLRRTEPTSDDQEASTRDGRWSITLPESSNGLHQDISYCIVAGDAVAGPFRVKVIPAPSIIVEEIEYTYPDYMQRAPLVFPDQGEVNTVEGTRVTVRANANQPIEYAYIEFDADQEVANRAPRRTLTMKHDGRDAWVTFTARLKPNGQTPWHSNYRVRFRNSDQAMNDRPVLHGIHVTPDIAPVVEILTPAMCDMDLPVDATQTIEIRALDPDYGLNRIAVKANVRDSDRSIERELLAQRPNEEPITGQRIVKFPFQPKKLGMRPGDIVDYQAVAADNRIDPGTGNPAANITTSVAYRFRILPAENPGAQDGGQNGEKRDQQRSDQPNADQQHTEQEAIGQPSDQPADDPNNQGSQPNAGQSNERQPNEGQSNEEQPNEGQSNEGQSNEGQSNEGQGQSNEGQSDEQQPNVADKGNDGAGKSAGPNSSSDQERSPDSGTGSKDGTSKDVKRDRPAQSTEGLGAQKGDGTTTGNESSGEQLSERATADRDAAKSSDQQRSKGGESERRPRDDSSSTSASDQGESQPNDGGSESVSRSDDVDAERNQQANRRRPSADNQDGESANTDESVGEDASTDDQDPLPNDGSRDGDAIRRILDRIRQRTGKQPETQQREQQPCTNCSDGSCENCQQGQTTPADDGSSESPQGGSAGGQRQPDGDDLLRDTQPNTGRKPAESSSSEDSGGSPKDQSDPGQGNRPGDRADPRQSGSGQNNDQQQSDSNQQSGSGDEKSTGDDPRQSPDGATKGQPGETPQQDAGAQPDASTGQPTDASPGDAAPSDSQPNSSADQTTGQSGDARLSQGSGQRSAGAATEDKGEPVESEGSEANLEYAREATDLVLDYLKNQQNRGDRELLERLGWTPEQLADFQRRWAKMKRDAQRNDPVGVSARGELDDVLRSLGLAPATDRMQAAGGRDDDVQVGNTGRRSRPPAAYRQRYERFLKSIQAKQ